MARIVELVTSLMEDVENSEELFGVKAEDLTENKIKYEFATAWKDKWFPTADLFQQLNPEEMYLKWFKQAREVIERTNTIILKEK